MIRPSSLVPTVPASFPFLRYFLSYLAWLGARYGTWLGLGLGLGLTWLGLTLLGLALLGLTLLGLA